MSPTHQDLSNDTTFSQIKSCVPVPLRTKTIVWDCKMCILLLVVRINISREKVCKHNCMGLCNLHTTTLGVAMLISREKVCTNNCMGLCNLHTTTLGVAMHIPREKVCTNNCSIWIVQSAYYYSGCGHAYFKRKSVHK